MTELVHGVGINDADYSVRSRVNGRSVLCPFYATWASMLSRCYSKKYQERGRSYLGCSVSPEWRVFSNFKKWMETQDWKCKQLDKDLLLSGNKVYSKENCIFVDPSVNKFTVSHEESRGDYPIGASWNKRSNKFIAYCNNQFTDKLEHLGYFNCPNQAHLAWKKRKHELACMLADLQTDARIADALRKKYQ